MRIVVIFFGDFRYIKYMFLIEIAPWRGEFFFFLGIIIIGGEGNVVL